MLGGSYCSRASGGNAARSSSPTVMEGFGATLRERLADGPDYRLISRRLTMPLCWKVPPIGSYSDTL